MMAQLRPFECTLHFYMTTLTWLLVVGSVFSLESRNENPISCIEKERQALLRFKHSIIDTENSLSSWNSSSEDGNCCKWVGISCDNETGYVISLDLQCHVFCYQPLAGELSPNSLPQLSYMSHLDLSGNNFTESSSILNELANLSNLKYLDLSSNAQLKVDTLEWVSGLSSLTYLGLNYLDLSSIADWVHSIRKLPMLQNLHLSHCQLQTPSLGISDNSSFGVLGRWITLDLSNNNLTGNFLHILEVLNVVGNNNNGRISSANLTLLDLSFNSLQGTISESFLSCLPNLQLLGLSHNLFTLSLSSHWVPPFHLKVMKLSSCNLGPNFPTWLHSHMDFEYLDISCNRIRDIIPDWFWNLSYKLRYLNLSFNSLSGTLPNTTLHLEYDCQIDLSYNEFSGQVKPFFSEAHLLNLSKNKFSVATSFLCSMVDSWLAYVDLSDNLLSGKLPDCHMNFSYLFILNLANNNLWGKIPTSLGSLESLASLDLSNNSFSGELPSSLQNKSNLLFLDLGENQLSGRVPGWNGQTRFVFLRLQSNKFHGEIPSTLCQLQSIQVLDLSLNNLSGEVPSCFNNFTAISRKTNFNNYYYYEFYHSILSTEDREYKFEVDYRDGAWFAWKGVKAEYHNTIALLKLIDLSANQLTGQIPEGLTSLYELVSLNLSRNHFSGNIPEKIGQLTQLNSLDLSNNRLSGRIPISMKNIYFLGYLDLSNNNLCGAIPKGTQLQSFDASAYAGNPQLCGLPILNVCPGDEILLQKPPSTQGNKHDDNWKENMGFYISLILGFVIGFWGVCRTLLLPSS